MCGGMGWDGGVQAAQGLAGRQPGCCAWPARRADRQALTALNECTGGTFGECTWQEPGQIRPPILSSGASGPCPKRSIAGGQKRRQSLDSSTIQREDPSRPSAIHPVPRLPPPAKHKTRTHARTYTHTIHTHLRGFPSPASCRPAPRARRQTCPAGRNARSPAGAPKQHGLYHNTAPGGT